MEEGVVSESWVGVEELEDESSSLSDTDKVPS